jgi:hypothetical protein
LLRQLRAESNGGELEEVGAAAATSFNLSNAQTAMAGICLSLAFAFGGVWFLRRKRVDRLGSITIIIGVVALCAASASVVFANAGPPPVARSLTSKILDPGLRWWGAEGKVNVTIVENGDVIELVLPKPPDDKTN